jgi:hypothetical protein
MIVFELQCEGAGHRFEGWFGSSDQFAEQQQRGLVTCPQCGSDRVIKAPMAPALGRKGNQQAAPEAGGAKPKVPMAGGALPPEAAVALAAMARLQAEALKKSRWVGERFAEVSRQMHYGEREIEVVHGQATRDEAESLLDEGIAVTPLPFPVAPPDELN